MVAVDLCPCIARPACRRCRRCRRERPAPGRGAGGFTLVEVLVALAIVAVALAAGMRAAAGVVDGAQRLADITAAQWCADNQLTALKLSRQFPGVGDADFSCTQLGRQYRGTLRTRPTPNPNFRRVDAVVQDAAGQPLLTVTSLASRL
ncbi:MAG: type II secretion system minor pseudopilin GspI [Rubrivivax sp.]